MDINKKIYMRHLINLLFEKFLKQRCDFLSKIRNFNDINHWIIALTGFTPIQNFIFFPDKYIIKGYGIVKKEGIKRECSSQTDA